MPPIIIKQFNKAKYVEKIIDSCETQEQIEACDKWVYQIDIDEDYKSHFHYLLVSKSKELLKL